MVLGYPAPVHLWHLPLVSLLVHAGVTYLVGFVLFMLGLFPVLGFGFGMRAVLHRLGVANRGVGDDTWQIILDFTLAVVGALLIAWLIHYLRRPLWRLIRRDLRLLRMIGRVVLQPFRRTAPVAMNATSH